MVRRRDHSDDPSGIVLTLRGTWCGFRGLFPVAVFSVPFGIGFGAAATKAGLSSEQSIAMSLATFSGTAQFSALTFLPGPVDYLSLTLVVLAVSARHVVMGAALAPWVNRLPLGRRLIALAWLSDPNFAQGQPAFRAGERDIGVLLGGGVALWLNWTLGTAIGAFGGQALGEVARYGFDVVMLCFFAAIVAGYMRSRANLAPIVIAALVAVVAVSILPLGWNVLVAALLGGSASLVRHGR